MPRPAESSQFAATEPAVPVAPLSSAAPGRTFRAARSGVPGAAVLVTTLGVISASGCGSRPPVIAIENARVESRDGGNALLLVDLSLENPNDVELVLQTFDYQVSAGDGFTGRRRAGVTLPPRGTARVTLPAVTSEPGPDATARLSGTVLFRSGDPVEQALFDAGIKRPRGSFSGTVPVK